MAALAQEADMAIEAPSPIDMARAQPADPSLAAVIALELIRTPSLNRLIDPDLLWGKVNAVSNGA